MNVLEALLNNKDLYRQTQIDFAYNNNKMEGVSITKDEVISLYESPKHLTSEITNHFTLFKYMLDTAHDKLTEDMIKHYHMMLKEGIDNELVGDYKQEKNYVGNIKTSLPKDVAKDMKALLEWYHNITNKSLEDIIEFHVRFESIHPFQDGNGRVGRMIMFKECLHNNIMPFYIEDRNKEFYIRGMREYQNNREKGYLIDTCLNSQDNYAKMVNYFLSDN